MKEIDEFLRDNKPALKDDPTFLLKTRRRLEQVEGIKAEVFPKTLYLHFEFQPISFTTLAKNISQDICLDYYGTDPVHPRIAQHPDPEAEALSASKKGAMEP